MKFRRRPVSRDSGLRADAGTPGNYDHYMKIEAYIVGIMIRPITKIMLTHFMPLASFDEHQGNIERVEWHGMAEAATGNVLWKKVSLKISYISQENTCIRISF